MRKVTFRYYIRDIKYFTICAFTFFFHIVTFYYILIFHTLKLMNTSCKIKRKNRRRVEKENSKMNTDLKIVLV